MTHSEPAREAVARREEQLRIQALGAALSRREWWEVEQAYNRIRDEFDRRPAPPAATRGAGIFGHHPDPSTDFCCEVETLEGWVEDVKAGTRSQWPFWGRLSALLRYVRSDEFSSLDDIAQRAKPIVLSLEGRLTAAPLAAPAPAVESAQVKEAFLKGFSAGESYHNSKWHHYKAPGLNAAWASYRASLATDAEG